MSSAGVVKGVSVESRLALLKQELESICDGGNGVWNQRSEFENVRRCVWPGQSSDGRKHREALGEDPFPFEEAADNRVRIVDQVINERAILCVLAAMRSQVSITGFRCADDGFGKRMERALKWIIRNVWGSEWPAVLMRLAQYREGDSPAAALAGVYWDRQERLRLQKVSIMELKQMALMELQASVDPEVWPEIEEQAIEQVDALDVALVSGDDSAEDEVLGILARFFPDVAESRLKKAVKQLRKALRDGEDEPSADFPVRVVERNAPMVVAHRIGEDVLLPLNMGKFQEARAYFRIEWLPEYAVRARAAAKGLKKDFVDELLKVSHESEQASPTFAMEGKGAITERVLSASGDWIAPGPERYKGLFQLVTAYYRAVDEDGIEGIYWMQFHPEIDVPANDPQLLDLPHGQYPGVFFAREFLSAAALDSRGWPELLGPAQSAIKDLGDGYNNFAKLTAVPTLVSKGRRSTARIKVGPLNEVRLKAGGDVRALDLGRFPTTSVQQERALRRDVDEYAGRGNNDVDPVVTQTAREWCTLTFLMGVRDVLMQTLQLWQAFSTPEEQAQITGAHGEELFRGPDDLEGAFRIDLKFDVQSMDMEYLQKKALIFKDVLMALDVDATIKWNLIVHSLFSSFDPDLAEIAVDSKEGAQQREVEEEELVWLKALAGIETQPQEKGQNFGARLEWLEQRMQMVAENEQVFGAVSPAAQEILVKRLEHLRFMVQQQENAQIGRVGV